MNIRDKYTLETETYRSPEQGKGSWSQLKCKVMQHNEDGTSTQIGEFIRSYHSLMRTWEPFELNGKEYALCSPRYTGTSVMELPSCKIIATEPDAAHGFCPTGFYVPNKTDAADDNDDYDHFIVYDDNDNSAIGTFGFVQGCVWGDDTSWKIQYLDLSKIEEGVISRSAKFGYVEKPPELSLRDCTYISIESGRVYLKLVEYKTHIWPLSDPSNMQTC